MNLLAKRNVLLAMFSVVLNAAVVAQAGTEKTAEKNPEETAVVQANTHSKQDYFPAGTVWLNTDYPVSFGTLANKISVFVVSDIHCLQCNQNIAELQELLLPHAAFQLVQIIAANPAEPLSRQFLLKYIQQNAINHPIGVVPDYSGFVNSSINQLPFFMVYEKTAIPSATGGGVSGFDLIKSKIEELKQNSELISSCYFNQIKPAIEYRSWADPFIETPTYIAAGELGMVYVNDVAHNRIVGLDGAGNCAKIIGNLLPGFKDDYLQQSRFEHAGGMTYFKGKLYIADTYNHRLRQVDFDTERVSTLVGNGQPHYDETTSVNTSREPLGLPTDCESWNGELYVVSGATNQIFSVDVKSGVSALFATVKVNKPNERMRISALNLAATDKFLYVVMSDGSVYKLDKKGKIAEVAPQSDWKISAVAEWKGVLYGCDNRKSVIGALDKNEWKVIAGTGTIGDLNGDAMMASFNHPFDMAVVNGELLVSDNQNHLIRRISSQKSLRVKNFNLIPSRELMGETAAHTYGEMVVMDTIYASPKAENIHVLLDLGGYEIVPDGRNEIDMDERMTGASISDFVVTNDSFNFSISSVFQQTDLYMELYLTLTDPAHPGVFLVKRSYLVYPVVQSEEQKPGQELLYSVNILPY